MSCFEAECYVGQKDCEMLNKRILICWKRGFWNVKTKVFSKKLQFFFFEILDKRILRCWTKRMSKCQWLQEAYFSALGAKLGSATEVIKGRRTTRKKLEKDRDDDSFESPAIAQLRKSLKQRGQWLLYKSLNCTIEYQEDRSTKLFLQGLPQGLVLWGRHRNHPETGNVVSWPAFEHT